MMDESENGKISLPVLREIARQICYAFMRCVPHIRVA